MKRKEKKYEELVDNAVQVQKNLNFYLSEIKNQIIFIKKFYENFKNAQFTNVDIYLELLHLKHIILHFDNIYQIIEPKNTRADTSKTKKIKQERKIQLLQYFENYDDIDITIFPINHDNAKNIDKKILDFLLEFVREDDIVLKLEKKTGKDTKLREDEGQIYKSFIERFHIEEIIDISDTLADYLEDITWTELKYWNNKK